MTSWFGNDSPKHIRFPAHGSSVVTCLLFSHGRIISASDDHSIHVYSPVTGELSLSLDGHEGGVWALAASKDTLVSGSTDRTVRIWDLATGKCTHVFGGHTSTVRCLSIVKPEMVEVVQESGLVTKEKWPKRPLIVTGSRDHSLRVWKLPRPGEPEYKCPGAEEGEPADDAEDNPYHYLHLEGHDHAVRALAVRGRTLVSGSYDCTVRIWDVIDGECKWVLTGHTQKVYSVVLDMNRHQACSGSMDGTVRVWNLRTGQCQHTLTGHTSLVGLLGLSPSHLVSAAADSTLRIWDPDTGELRHTLAAHTGAITCFQHDEFKVLSGSDGNLKMWNIRDGSVVRDLLTGITGVWQVVFEGRWCVAASNRNDSTVLDVWDFGSEADDDWIGEPPNGIYDDDAFSDCEEEEEDMRKVRSVGVGRRAGKRVAMGEVCGMDEDEDDEQEQADVDAMDQDLVPSDSEYSELEVVGRVTTAVGLDGKRKMRGRIEDVDTDIDPVVVDSDDDYLLETAAPNAGSSSTNAARWVAQGGTGDAKQSGRSNRPSPSTRAGQGIGASGSSSRRREVVLGGQASASSSSRSLPAVPSYQETPTRPRIRPHASRRR